MSEEDKVLKRQKIEQNRAKKRPHSENGRPVKIKKGCIEDFEDNSMSVNSVASTISDTYFWESDRKYTDLDANRQNVTESMSPVTAASVPSPSSPPENATIASSKTLDMLKESSRNSGSSFEKFEQSSLRYESEGDTETTRGNTKSPVQMKQRFNEFNVTSQGLQKDKISGKFEQNLLDFNAEFEPVGNESPKYSPKFETTSSYSKFGQSPGYVDQTSGPRMMHVDLSPTIGGNLHVVSAESTVCQKPKGMCPKEKNLITKLTQDPELVVKFLNHPNFVAKIFQDQTVLLKLMSDPDVVTRLAADPQISQFLEKNSAIEKEEKSENDIDVQFKDELKTNDIPDTVLKHMLKGKQTHVENPILTDLIMDCNPDEHGNYNTEPGTSSDWSKSPIDVTKDVLQDVQRIPIAANSIESILCEAIKLEFSAYSALGNIQNRRELNDAERAKLNELIVANKALLIPLDEDITNLVGEDCKFKSKYGVSDPMLLDVINLTAIAIRRLIKMAKKIHAFKNMCQEDQIALLKGGCTEMMILRSAINYDPEKEMWRIPHTRESMSNIKADVLKEAKGNLYTEHARFVRAFDPRWRDENIILILSAIALFTPDRPKVVHSDVVKLEQNSYYYLLRRYLESVYPGCEAKSMFLKLIQKISELHRLNNEVVGVYLNVNPSSVEPLLIEIFDLKQ